MLICHSTFSTRVFMPDYALKQNITHIFLCKASKNCTKLGGSCHVFSFSY